MAGRYESRYLRAVDPARPRGAWIRYTTLQRPGSAPTGALWCTVWDAEAGPPYTVKESFPEPVVPGGRAAGTIVPGEREAGAPGTIVHGVPLQPFPDP
ncbi:MAG: hypothetical protein ACRDPC_04815 [Solirubrobacteraceae bacterium]